MVRQLARHKIAQRLKRTRGNESQHVVVLLLFAMAVGLCSTEERMRTK